MSKKTMLIVGPLSSRSGYGDHARDIFHSFYNLDKYEIKVFDVRWGSCPRNALNENNPKDKLILDRLSKEHKLNNQPDICVDVRIPNEFTPIGKYNIGITAGIETNAVSQAFLEGCNRMDLILVPSEHAKMGFTNSKYDKLQQMPDGKQQKVGELKLEKPIEVLFEGEDLDIWKPLLKSDNNLMKDTLSKIDSDFIFLHVGLWGSGGYGEDRKDIGKLVKVFLETFAGCEQNCPALLLKTNGATYSIGDKENTLKRIRDIKNKFPSNIPLPEIYLLHGSLDEEEMNALYNHPKVKSFVSFTHGEGFGRPMLEATLTGLPVIASNWSGQVDFLDKKHSVLIDGSFEQVPKSQVWKNIVIPESQWFVIDERKASESLKFVYENYLSVSNQAKELMKINREKFSHDSMTKLLGYIIDNHYKDAPKQVEFKLPKLEAVGVE